MQTTRVTHPTTLAARLRFVLPIIALIAGCGGGGGGGGAEGASDTGGQPPANAGVFTLNEPMANALVANGVPRDAATFVASQRVETLAEEPRRFRFLQTFPNGASRDIAFRFGPTQTYTPTAAEASNAAASGQPVYAVRRERSEDGKVIVNRLQYFMPFDAMPVALSQRLQTVSVASAVQNWLTAWVSTANAAESGMSGTTVYVEESAKEGVDTGIGSLLDYAKDKGSSGIFAALYAFASALSDISGAFDLRADYKKSEGDLDRLGRCAANPTNPLSKSDPNYSKDTAGKVNRAKSEAKEVAAMRFLNAMTDTATGVNPWLSVLKAGLVWNDRTLKDFNDNTIMREASLAVVPCGYPLDATLTLSYTNAYDKCDDICHHYEEEMAVSASFRMEVTAIGGYYASLDTGSIRIRDADQLTDGRALNPPYHVSHENTAAAVPRINGDGGPMPAPEGSVVQDYAELMKGKRRIEVKANAPVMRQWSSTDVISQNNKPTTTTSKMEISDGLYAFCRFDEVDATLGGTYSAVSIESHYPGYRPDGKLAKPECKITLKPIEPA